MSFENEPTIAEQRGMSRSDMRLARNGELIIYSSDFNKLEIVQRAIKNKRIQSNLSLDEIGDLIKTRGLKGLIMNFTWSRTYESGTFWSAVHRDIGKYYLRRER